VVGVIKVLLLKQKYSIIQLKKQRNKAHNKLVELSVMRDLLKKSFESFCSGRERCRRGKQTTGKRKGV